MPSTDDVFGSPLKNKQDLEAVLPGIIMHTRKEEYKDRLAYLDKDSKMRV